MSAQRQRAADVAAGAIEALHVPSMLQPDHRQVVAGRTREKAVELFRETRCADERVPTAVRAADHVGVLRAPAVVVLDDGFRDRRQRDVRCIPVVEAGLCVETEQIAADETGLGIGLAVVAGIRAQGRVAAGERVVRLIAAEVAVRRYDRAVVAAVHLVEVAAVPAVG